MFSEVVERIQRLSYTESQIRYARALTASLTFDLSGKNPPCPLGPEEIAKDDLILISVNDLDEFNIVLRRKQIAEFLPSYFGKKILRAEVTRWFKATAYEDFFGRPVAKGGNQTGKSPTVYTYAEVLQRLHAEDPYRFDFRQQLTPPEVTKLLSDLGIDFPYIG